MYLLARQKAKVNRTNEKKEDGTQANVNRNQDSKHGRRRRRGLADAGFVDQTYVRYAVEATYARTNLATFKAVEKKHPDMPKETILCDLVASQPGQEGKWFAATKDAGFFELAIELANGVRQTRRRS